jgi:hypothetical protein
MRRLTPLITPVQRGMPPEWGSESTSPLWLFSTKDVHS